MIVTLSVLYLTLWVCKKCSLNKVTKVHKLFDNGEAVWLVEIVSRVSCRILSWGEGKQDGSRMIVVCETHACLLGGSGGMPSQENFEFIYLSDYNLGQNFQTF